MSDRTRRTGLLSVADHDRASTGMTYVYPVFSRRAGGVSVGINLNPNNACNWRCVYCQVEDLVLDKAPRVDLELLKRELTEMLDAIVNGDFLERSAPPGARRLSDIAFSGNGEPTSSPDFRASIDVVAEVERQLGLSEQKVVLITNGSLAHKPPVLAALGALAGLGGEVWFKLDRATDEGLRRVNSCSVPAASHVDKLRRCARACPTWVQTCWFRWDGEPPSEAEQEAYFECLAGLVREGVPLSGVHLYTLARPSHQPEAPRLAALDAAWLEARAARIAALGLTVKVSA
jgi:wyosine [tRNA(Phe)-imidazoG37] synthetase (radical SAM superfamily)